MSWQKLQVKKYKRKGSPRLYTPVKLQVLSVKTRFQIGKHSSLNLLDHKFRSRYSQPSTTSYVKQTFLDQMPHDFLFLGGGAGNQA